MDAEFVSKYPFASAARKLLSEVGRESVSADKLRLAGERVLSILSNKPVPLFSSAREAASSFALSRLIVFAWDRPSTAWKYAHHLVKRSFEKIEDSEIQELAEDFFPSLKIVPFSEGEKYAVSLFDFLAFDGELVYAPLEKGQLFFSRDEFKEVLKDAAVRRVAAFQGFSRSQIPPIVFDIAKELEPRIPREQSQRTGVGKYLALPCMQRIAQGLPEGKRYYGSMALSIACVKDGLAHEDAVKILQQYVEGCAKGSQAYTLREATATLDWVYKHASIGFSCNMMKEQGVIDSCEGCTLRNSRATSAEAGKKKAFRK